MGIIYGMHWSSGAMAQLPELLTLSRATERWATDGTFLDIDGTVGMGCQPYLTHERSRSAVRPIRDALGNMIAFDGRLDNHQELRLLLDLSDPDASDAEIVLAALRRWGEQSFSKLVGEWAVALWHASEQTLYLARDHAGTRPLYFMHRRDEVRWSSYLETLLCGEGLHRIEEGYLARFLLGRPIGDFTPYDPILSVTPGHVVAFHEGRRRRFQHWCWLPKRMLQYRDDADYEEQLLVLLRQSVERRTGPGCAILAQLSGGIDSSTIVCTSDTLRITQGRSVEELLDTVSFYDDSEPHWDERPYFTAVEAHRGKTGIHVDVSSAGPTFRAPEMPDVPLLPGLDSGSKRRGQVFEEQLKGRDYRVILSGLGGDELLGGVPSPLPELSDRLMAGDLRGLLQSSVRWGLANRQPLIHLLWDTVSFSASPLRAMNAQHRRQPPWINRALLDRVKEDERGSNRFRLLDSDPLPSSVATADACQRLLETLPNPQLATGKRREYRFPYLDRDLVEFLLSVPSEQLVRPGRRRSLMRRAVKRIVPAPVLERRRKGYLTRGASLSILEHASTMKNIVNDSLLARHGYVCRDRYARALDEAIAGRQSDWAHALIRTCEFELWLDAHPPVTL